MTIDQATDSAALFMDATEILRFRVSPSATPRENLQAKVRRNPIGTTEGEDKGSPFPGHRAPVMHVQLRNHATAGVLPSEIVEKTSEIEVPFPLGASTEAAGLRWRKITRILKHTAGVVLLEVQT